MEAQIFKEQCLIILKIILALTSAPLNPGISGLPHMWALNTLFFFSRNGARWKTLVIWPRFLNYQEFSVLMGLQMSRNPRKMTNDHRQTKNILH